MNKKKLIKMILMPTLLVASFSATGTCMLTSCGNWGFLSPYFIGSATVGSENDPYYNFRKLNETSNKYYDLDHIDMLTGKDYSAKPEGSAKSLYLQSLYSKVSSTNNNNSGCSSSSDSVTSAYYSYANPTSNWNNGKEKWKDHAKWKNESSGWYSSSQIDTKAVKGDKNVMLYNYKNSTIATNTDFISGLAANYLEPLITSALDYQALQISKDDVEEKNLTAAWGGSKLNHGSKSGSDEEQKINNKFYEYLYASANLNPSNKAKAFLRISNLNYNFKTGYFPIPSYRFADKWGDIESELHSEDISSATKILLQSNKISTVMHPEETVDDYHFDDYDNLKTYWTSKETKKDQDNKEYFIYTFDAVPVVVNFKSMIKTYVDPTISKTFLASQCYVNDKNKIINAIGDSWKKSMINFTNKKAEECIPTIKTFQIANTNSEKKSISLAGKYDERLTDIKGDDFVVLLQYQVKQYKDDASVGKANEKNTCTINVSAKNNTMFPAYFIDLFKDCIFKKANNNANSGYILDSTEVNKHLSELLSLYKHVSADGKKPNASDVSEEGKKLLSFLKYMFANSKDELNSDKFISVLEEIA